MSPAGAPRPPTAVEWSSTARTWPPRAEHAEPGPARRGRAGLPRRATRTTRSSSSSTRSFGYRIDESERKIFEEAEEAGEIVSPPAGAIGRGDGFLLRIADRIDADVLSNDSFQEFHGEYTWLFEEGRLIGGKPVPGVGLDLHAPHAGARAQEPGGDP